MFNKITIIFICLLLSNNAYGDDTLNKVKLFNENAEKMVELMNSNQVTKYTKKFLGAIGVVTDILTSFIGDDSVMKKLEAMMNEIRNSFEDVRSDIANAVSEIEGFIEQKKFETEVEIPARQLFVTLQNYFTAPDQVSLGEALAKCRPPPYNYLESMNEMLDRDSILTETKPDRYSYESFKKVKNLYNSMVKLLLISMGICDNIHYQHDSVVKRHEYRYKVTLDLTKQIEDKIEEQNNERKDEYWPNAVVDTAKQIMESMADLGSYQNENVAKTIVNKLNSDYPEWDDYFVGVYDDIKGFHNHALYGVEYELIKRYKKRNTFIYRRPKDVTYQKCDIETIVKDNVCVLMKNKKTLMPLAEKIANNCTTARFIGVIVEKSNLGVASTLDDSRYFDNFHENCWHTHRNGLPSPNHFDLSVVIGW